MALYCPVSGTRVFENPKWIDQDVTHSFTSNFWILGDSIIYSRPRGRGCIDSVRRSLMLNDEVAEYISEGHRSYIQIEDYAHMTGSTSEARRYFVNRMDTDKHLTTLIFCNLSPALSIAVNIGRRLNTTGKSIHVVKLYSDAIKLALELSDQPMSESKMAPIDLGGCFDDVECNLSPIDLLADDSWKIRTPEYSNTGMVIDQSILHSTSEGHLELKHLPLIDSYRDKCVSALQYQSSFDYIVVDCRKFGGGSRAARIGYMKSLVNWHKRRPFRMFIGYGTNTFMKTALLLAMPLMPFKVRIAKDIKHAFQFLRDDRIGRFSEGPTINEDRTPYVVEPGDMDKIMAFIGSINWESQGIDTGFDIDSGHPFFFLYQSIKLIKEELDELFTERKRFEAQLYQARKMESVGTIAAGVAHDFNNILAIISGNTGLALRETKEGDPVRLHLEAVQNATMRANDVVNQLLNFSRKSEQNLRPIDAVAVIKDAVKLLRATIPSTINIRGNFPDADVTISADPTQIIQVLMNLFANSAQAMASTGGNLQIDVARETATGRVGESHQDSAGGACLRVSVNDNGPGIDPDLMDRIFDPYFTTKEVGKGSGMGLAVVLGIVKNHGGSISVDSELGNGTTFTLLFPLVNEKPTLGTYPSAIRPHGHEWILFIDDEEAIVEMMRKILEQLGYKVETSVCPTKALELFRSRSDTFDVVITDMTMPQMTGIELSAKLKDIRADIPIIICTGYSSLIDEAKAKDLGIAAIAMKPADIQDMAMIIRRVLNNRTQTSTTPTVSGSSDGARD